MGERKVLNKYIPADFDPKLVPRGSKPKDDLVPVRMMLPFTVQCSTCSDFMYRGRKFNSKKEPVKGSEGKYLGIQRYRFYIKCTACSRPVTFLTDPKNGDYEMESGGTRTYEVHKDKKRIMEEVEADGERLEKEDPMKALENRVLASQKEMADLDNLDEIKAMNMRHLKMMSSSMKNGDVIGNTGGIDIEMVLRKTRKDEVNKKDNNLELDEEDEALIKSIKFGNQANTKDKPLEPRIIRLSEKEEEEIQRKRKTELEIIENQQTEMLNKAQVKTASKPQLNPLIKVKRKRKSQVVKNNKREKLSSIETEKEKQESTTQNTGDALGLLGGYSSDDS